MSDELDRVTERLRQNRTVRQTELDAATAQQRTAASRAGGTFVAGDRVFDTISGQEGDVLSATGFGRVASALVDVQLDGGSLVTRQPAALVLRPPLPAVKG